MKTKKASKIIQEAQRASSTFEAWGIIDPDESQINRYSEFADLKDDSSKSKRENLELKICEKIRLYKDLELQDKAKKLRERFRAVVSLRDRSIYEKEEQKICFSGLRKLGAEISKSIEHRAICIAYLLTGDPEVGNLTLKVVDETRQIGYVNPELMRNHYYHSNYWINGRKQMLENKLDLKVMDVVAILKSCYHLGFDIKDRNTLESLIGLTKKEDYRQASGFARAIQNRRKEVEKYEIKSREFEEIDEQSLPYHLRSRIEYS